MANMNPEQERLRLAELYAEMSEGELQRVLDDWEQLTDIAHDAARAEAEKRKLEAPMIGENEPTGSDDFVMLRRFRDLPEAMMAKGGLESAGIDCQFVDENMVRMDWFWSNLLGGVKLFVRAEDVDAATEVLGEPAPQSFEVEGVGTYERPHCPKCSSMEITFEELNKPVAYGSAWLGVPIPLHRNGWICHSCEHKWDESAEAGTQE
jgi:hypothetical protein